MPLTVILITGPRNGGKTTLVDLIGRDVLDHAPHHIRLVSTETANDAMGPPASTAPPTHVAASIQARFTDQSAMDVLTDALRAVRRKERYATVLVEGDDAPSLRHAFPYDRRVFVMPAPNEFHAIFRRPGEAAAALRKVMQDTEGFAAEMFGLLFDETGVQSPDAYAPEERRRRSAKAMDSKEVRRFLNTPLGAEIASRIQLQPGYQGLVESDLVAINTARDAMTKDMGECVQCIERLMARTHQNGVHRRFLYCCDPQNGDDPVRAKLLRRLAEICDDPL